MSGCQAWTRRKLLIRLSGRIAIKRASEDNQDKNPRRITKMFKIGAGKLGLMPNSSSKMFNSLGGI